MTETRLIHSGTLEQRRLLRAAQCDGPSRRFKQQLLLSVSLGSVVLAESTATGTTSACAAPAPLPAAPSGIVVNSSIAAPAATSTSIAVLVKWIGIASVALFASVGAGFVAGTTLASQRADSTTVAALPAAFTDDVPVTAMPSTRSVQIEVAPLHLQVEAPALPVAGRIRSGHARPSTNQSVAGEVQLVDAARVALRAGDATQCLQWLAERHRRFPQGLLGPEAALIRIEALTQSGQLEAARESGRQFLEAYPTGPLSNRVKSLLSMPLAPRAESGMTPI